MSTPQVAGRPWDSFDGYLFDIDGTLLHCSDAVHYFAFCAALKTLSGRDLTLEGVTAHGNTDIGILRDALALAAVPSELWRPRLSQIRQSMGRFVTDHQHELRADALPAVHELLRHLRDRGATLGIATGNLAQIGALKLQHAGLRDYFSIGGWSDAFETRTAVFDHAIQLMRHATHSTSTLCVLGDTPADILAAHANGLPVIAVATGVYSREQLLATNPDLCLQSFADLLPPVPPVAVAGQSS